MGLDGTRTERAGRVRTPSIPGHELSGTVVELGFGTTGLTAGQRVFGLTDWTRNGSLAEYTAVEARNLAPLAADIDHTVAAALPISGVTAWQGLVDHAHLSPGQTVLIRRAAGGVGSIAVQLAREVGAHVIGTGRADDRDVALSLGAQPKDGRALFFVVEPDRVRLTDLAQRLRTGRLNPIVGGVRPLSETASAFARHRRAPGTTIIQVADEQGTQHS